MELKKEKKERKKEDEIKTEKLKINGKIYANGVEIEAMLYLRIRIQSKDFFPNENDVAFKDLKI